MNIFFIKIMANNTVCRSLKVRTDVLLINNNIDKIVPYP